MTIDRLVGSKKINVKMTMTLTPLPHSEDTVSQPLVELDEGSTESSGDFSKEEILTAIERGVASACIRGVYVCNSTVLHTHKLSCIHTHS